jgi:hypothetical protein
MYRNGKKILNAVNHINITWFTWRYIYDIKGIYIYYYYYYCYYDYYYYCYYYYYIHQPFWWWFGQELVRVHDSTSQAFAPCGKSRPQSELADASPGSMSDRHAEWGSIRVSCNLQWVRQKMEFHHSQRKAKLTACKLHQIAIYCNI